MTMRFKLHSKTPLPIVLGIVINLVLVIAVEVLGFYNLPAEITERDFARIGSKYESCNVVAKTETGQVNFYLVEAADGQAELIPVQRHAFFPGRAKIVKRKITPAEELTEDGSSLRMAFGLQMYDVRIHNQIIQVSVAGGVAGTQAILSRYMLFALVLALLELGLWSKLRGE